MDETNYAIFVVFDRDASLLLNKSCDQMIEAHEAVCQIFILFPFLL